MGKKQKQKGNRIERKIVSMLAERSVESKRTWGSSGASMGLADEVDIVISKINKNKLKEITFICWTNAYILHFKIFHKTDLILE